MVAKLKDYNRRQIEMALTDPLHRYYTAQRFRVANPTRDQLLQHWAEKGGAEWYSKQQNRNQKVIV